MRSTPGRSNRRKRLRNVVLLVLLVAAAIAAGVVELSSGIRREINQYMMRGTADRTEQTLRDTLDKLFSPVQGHLSVIERWGERGALDLKDHAYLNDRFVPMMEQFPWASSMLIADEDGVEYLLLRTDSTWVTRETDATRQPGVMTWRSWHDQDSIGAEWAEETGYDARTRPWYRTAVEERNVDERGISWTDPYPFFTSGQIGVTLSRRWYTRGEGRRHVAGVDIPLEAVLEFTDSLMTSRNGYTFLVNRDRKIVAGDTSDASGGARDPNAFEAAVLSAWTSAGSPLETPIFVDQAGGGWWVDFRAAAGDTTRLLLAVTVPESSFKGEVRGLQHRFALMVAGLFALGMLLTVVVAQIVPSRESRGTLDLSTERAVLELIAQGEGDRLEFKSTLRWNINTDKPGKEVEMSWLKTVVAYLNTGGGVLMIGVGDDGQVTGMETDRFPSVDKFLLHYNNLFKQHIGVDFTRYVETDVVAVGDRHVFVIQCGRSDDPVYLKQGKDERFYVRVGPSSRQLSTSEAVEWVRKNRS